MKKLLGLLLVLGMPLMAQNYADDLSDNEDDCGDLCVECPDCPDCMIEEEWVRPYEVDIDEFWIWENETQYPTKKEDSWVEDLSRPW
jgi:hypothetical protein